MLANFTHRARRVMVLARQETERMKRNYIDTEHVLLGLVMEGTSVAAKTLLEAKVELGKLREVAGELFGPAPDFVSYGQMPYAPDVRAIFNRAEEEAHEREHVFVDAEHLLIGLMKVDDCQALKVLEKMGTDLDQVWDKVSAHLDEVEQPQLRPSSTGQVVMEATGIAFGQSMDRFSERARRVIEQSRHEAEVLRHDRIGTEHLLLGLLAESSGVAAAVLFNMGADAEKVRMALFKFATPSSRYATAQQFPLTIQVKDALRFSVEEAKKLKHDYVGTEHLLLGLLRVSAGPVERIFKSLSLDVEAIRREVLKLMGTKDPFTSGRQKQADVSEEIWPERGITDPARKALDLAVEAARTMEASRVFPEHLLIGLFEEGANLAVKVLEKLNVDLARVREEAKKLEKPSGSAVDPVALAPDPEVRKVLHLAKQEASNAGRDHIGTEHILLALIAEKKLRSLQVLEALGVQALNVREKLRELRPPELDAYGSKGHMDTQFLLMRPPTDEETVWTDYDWAQEHTSEQASRALFLAGLEADRLGAPFTGTEHLLLGLLAAGKGRAADVLVSSGLTLEALRTAAKDLSSEAGGADDTASKDGQGEGVAAGIDRPFSASFAEALKQAKDEARDRHHTYLGTEHLLLGLLAPTGKVAKLLAAHNVDPQEIKETVCKSMATRA